MKLFPSKPADQVVLTVDAAGQGCGYLFQAFVALYMAVCIIVLFEIVNIYHDDSHRYMKPYAIGNQLLQPEGIAVAVEKLCQRVLVGPFLKTNLFIPGLSYHLQVAHNNVAAHLGQKQADEAVKEQAGGTWWALKAGIAARAVASTEASASLRE